MASEMVYDCRRSDLGRFAGMDADMRFDVMNRFTGAVQFTAEINCDDYASRSTKLGLAARWAVKSKANLTGANLTGARLSGAELSGASLFQANLFRADLTLANLTEADLTRASLSRADVEGTNLTGVNLTGVDFNGTTGVNDHIKCIQIDTYPITYTADVIQIGCQRHTHRKWAEFNDAQIRHMDGEKAVEWWARYKAWLFRTIEICPATPTQESKL